MKNKILMFGIAIIILMVNLSFAQVPVETTPTSAEPNSTEKQDNSGRKKGEGKRKNGGKKNKEGKQKEKEDNDDDDKKGGYDRRDQEGDNDNNEVENNDNARQQRGNKVNTPEVRAAKMTERLTRQLGLDEVTAKSVNGVALERANKVDAINNSNDDAKTKQEAFAANKQDFEAKLKGVLSADQFAKYQTLENGGGDKGNRGNRSNNENRGNKGKGKGNKGNRGGKDKGDN